MSCPRPHARQLMVFAAAPHPEGMNIQVLLGRAQPPKLSPGRRHGETRFPHPPARRLRPHPPAGGVWGTLVSPHPTPKDNV